MPRRVDLQEISTEPIDRFWWALNHVGRTDRPDVARRASRRLTDLAATDLVTPSEASEWVILRRHLPRARCRDLVRLAPWLDRRWEDLLGPRTEGEEDMARIIATMGAAGLPFARRYLSERRHVSGHGAFLICWTESPELMAVPDIRSTLISVAATTITVAEAMVPVVAMNADELEQVLAPWWCVFGNIFARLLTRAIDTPGARLTPDRLVALASSPEPLYREAALHFAARL